MAKNKNNKMKDKQENLTEFAQDMVTGKNNGTANVSDKASK